MDAGNRAKLSDISKIESFQSSPRSENSLSDSRNSLVMFQHKFAELLDMNKVDPIPRYVSSRKRLEIINVAFMRTCNLEQLANGSKIEADLFKKNMTYIAEVLEMLYTERKSRQRYISFLEKGFLTIFLLFQ